jgi:hypothetical protein
MFINRGDTMKYIFLLAAFFSLPIATYAQQSISNDSITIRSHYSYWGVGYASTDYSDAFELALDMTQGDRSKIVGTADVLGFYWPIHNNRSLLGVIAHGVIENNSGDGGYANIAQASIVLSGVYFINETIGAGPFIRLDGGPTAIATFSSNTEVISPSIGIGVLAGIGYMIPLTTETSLAVGANYSARAFSSHYASTLGFTIGTLF